MPSGVNPTPTFKGLQDEDTRKLRNTMYRPIDPTHDGKNNKLRESGLPHQYKKEGGDIINFRRDIWTKAWYGYYIPYIPLVEWGGE